MIAFSIPKFNQDIIPHSNSKVSSQKAKNTELSISEKIKEIVVSPFNHLANLFKYLASNISQDFFSKKNLINLTLIITFSSTIFYTLGISEIIFQVLVGIISIKLIDPVFNKLIETSSIPNLNETFPVELKNKIILKILTGVVAFIILGNLEMFLLNKISLILKNYSNISITEKQNIQTLMEDTDTGSTAIILNIYVAIVAPILEEYFFRGCLHNYFEAEKIEHEQQKEMANKNFISRLYETYFKPQKSLAEIKAAHPSSLSQDKIKTILKVSLIFGLCHLSPVMGWTNIPIMLVATLMGAVMSILKETTGDLWASTTLHMVNNTLSVLKLRKII
jgi:membrane protease YdiL (CAAX protease family)